MKINLKKWPDVLLVLLLATSLGFIVLDILYNFGSIEEFKFLYYSIDVDKGMAESYQYCLEFWIVLLFIIQAYNRKDPRYLFWSLTFVYILCDDVYRLHERGGKHVIANLDLRRLAYGPFGQGPASELIYFALPAAIFFLFLSILYKFGSLDFKKVSKTMVILIALLTFFGLGVDLLHSAIYNKTLYAIMTIVEEGGELVSISLMVYFAFKFNSEDPNSKKIEYEQP